MIDHIFGGGKKINLFETQVPNQDSQQEKKKKGKKWYSVE
jgi:ribosomal protein L2